MEKSKTKHRDGGQYPRHPERLDPIWEEDDADWLAYVRGPWKKRWAIDPHFGRNMKDNEGWDSDRINERRLVRKSSKGGQTREG